MNGQLVSRPTPPTDVSTAARGAWDLAVEKFLRSQRRKATRQAYGTDLKQWRAWADDLDFEPLLEARRWHVDDWARSLEDADLRPKTVARKLSAVASFYAYLQAEVEEQGGSMINPTRHVRRPEVGADFSATIALDEDELNDVIEAARRLGPVEHVAVLLLASTGIRVSELLNARISDYTIDHRQTVIFVTRKGGKRAKVCVPPKVAHVLDVFLDGRTEGFLLDAEQVPHWWLYRQCVRAGQRAGLGVEGTPKAERKVTPHVLRATFATLYLSSRTSNLAWLQDAMGHADGRTTRGYDRGAGQLDRLAAVVDEVASHIKIKERD